MAKKKWPFKDPDEILDYEIKWADRIGTSDPITTSTWTVPVGITKTDQSNDNTNTIIWLSGGTIGETYAILNEIVTSAGRRLDQTVYIKIKAK